MRNTSTTTISYSLSDYPFGMLIPARSFSAGSIENYRFGFNSQEQDDEVYGNGNLNTAQYWQYDTRIGKRWNIDPQFKYHESPYSCFANNPISFVDPIGRDTTRDQQGNLVWKVESGDTYENISQKLIDYGLETSDITESLKEWNSSQTLEEGSFVSLFATQSGYPVFYVYATGPNATPTIYAFDAIAIARYGNILFYLGPQKDPAVKATVEANRTANTADCRDAEPIPGTQIDEYPYASTINACQGGMCAPVPTWENSKQGGYLGNFYKKLAPFQPFIVVLVAGDPVPPVVPVLAPVPQTDPQNSPKTPDPANPIPVLVPVLSPRAVNPLSRAWGTILFTFDFILYDYSEPHYQTEF